MAGGGAHGRPVHPSTRSVLSTGKCFSIRRTDEGEGRGNQEVCDIFISVSSLTLTLLLLLNDTPD